MCPILVPKISVPPPEIAHKAIEVCLTASFVSLLVHRTIPRTACTVQVVNRTNTEDQSLYPCHRRCGYGCTSQKSRSSDDDLLACQQLKHLLQKIMN